MSESDIQALSVEDHELCLSATNSCDCIPTRQSGADSDSYDTDDDAVTNKPPSTERRRRGSVEAECVDEYLTACDQNQVAPQAAIVRGLACHQVNVRHRCLGDQDAHALSTALCKNTTVTHLQLAGNSIGALGTVYLKTVLTLNQNITYLDLSENNLGRDVSCCLAISDALRLNHGLRSLLLARNNLRDQDAAYLAAGILANTDLVHVDLSQNLVAETGSVHLGRAFATNTSVEELNLSANCIRQRGAVAMCKGLQENGYVSKLDLSWNGFGYEGSLAVGELLRKNSTLIELDLSSNRVNWKAAQFIAKGLSNNTTLEKLKLDMNPLTTTGCMDLIDVISTNQRSALNTLSLQGVPVLSEFELVSMMIRHSRPRFTCQHGGVVSSPDTLGQRIEKTTSAIEKLAQFMKDREYRTAEFFRMLDKNGSRALSHDELASRMSKIGVKLNSHELEELMDFIQTMSDSSASLVDYKTMSQGIKGHRDQERNAKIEEKKRNETLRRYHKDILTVPDNDSETSGVTLPPIIDCDTEEDMKTLMATLKCGVKPSDIASDQRTAIVTGNAAKTGNVMSMSRSLGSKAVPFGKTAVQGRKKTKKKAVKVKAKPKPKNYDDEGVGIP